VPLWFALGRRLIISSAALLTSVILVNREPLVQARLLPAVLSDVCSDIINGLGAGEDRGVANLLLSPRTSTGAIPGSVASASIPLSLGRGIDFPTQSQASYRSASPGPSARRPSSCFADTEEANVRANFDVIVEHADARASTATTDDDNDDDANDGDFPDILGEILGATFMASPVPDFYLTFGAAISNVDFDRTLRLCPLSPIPHPTSPRLSFFICCCLGANLRSRSFH